MSANKIIYENFWVNKYLFDDAERRHYESIAKKCAQSKKHNANVGNANKLVNNSKNEQQTTEHQQLVNGNVNNETMKSKIITQISESIARCRQEILLALQGIEAPLDEKEIVSQLETFDKENDELRKEVSDLQTLISKLEKRVVSLEIEEGVSVSTSTKSAPIAAKKAEPAADDDDDVDLFGSDDEEDAAANELREQRLKEYAEKKSKKKEVIAKSSVVLDVKPWDDETDMVELEKCVRSLVKDGLVWGVSKLVPVAYNVKKLQIVCVVEDDKVSIEELSEQIQEFEEYVQSVDIAAFQKI